MADEVKRVEGWEYEPSDDTWKHPGGDWVSLDTHLKVGIWAGGDERFSVVPLPVLRALLLSQGMHIVGEAEVRKLASLKAVVEEVTDWLEDYDDTARAHIDGIETILCVEVAEEFARRAAKGE